MEVLVEFDYAAEEPDELTIKKGDIIKDVTQFEEGWYIGNLNGKVGVFPDNFVKTVENGTTQNNKMIPVLETVREPKPETKKITETETEENRLGTVSKTQKVTGIGLGNIFSGQPIQLKQTALKDVIKDTESNTEKSTSCAKGDGPHLSSVADHVRARFDYQPKQSDELELHVDDVIQVLDRNLPDEGWWKGKNLTTKKIGVFPDNFVIPISEEERADRTQVSPAFTANAAAEPPKIAAKPSPIVGDNSSRSGLKSVSVTIAGTQRDSPKVTVANAPNLTSNRNGTNNVGSPVAVLTSAVTTATTNTTGPASGRINRWRTTSEHSDAPKTRAEETHAGSSGDLGSFTGSSDNNHQRLVNLTAERPKQAGRRLPSKFSQSLSPSNEEVNRNGYNDSDTKKRGIPVSAAQNNPNLDTPFSTSLHDEAQDEQTSATEHNRSVFTRNTEVGQRAQQRPQLSTGNKPGSLYRSETAVGSSDLNRSHETLASKLAPTDGQKGNSMKVQMQLEQLQTQHNQHVNEYKQQIRDLKKQIEQLKESNQKLRSEMVQSQRVVTERIQTLMDEVDEAKKQRAADAVELTRLRSMLMQLDAKSIMTTSAGRHSSVLQSRHVSQFTDPTGDDSQHASKENDAQSIYDGDENSEVEKAPTQADSCLQKQQDSKSITVVSGKTSVVRNPTASRFGKPGQHFN